MTGWFNYACLLAYCVAAGYLSGDVFPARDRTPRTYAHLCSWCRTRWTARTRIARCPNCPYLWS